MRIFSCIFSMLALLFTTKWDVSLSFLLSQGTAQKFRLHDVEVGIEPILAAHDTKQIGSLTVPSIGIGTIAWSSNSLTKEKPAEELQLLVDTAIKSNVAFFDTAERYGSHWKTAVGMGWGETERLLRHLLPTSSNPATVATKFTPSPWRTTVSSVLEACQKSRQNLGVEAIDLYQIHMPDIFQNNDQVYWRGLVEGVQNGWVKNIGVCNYGSSKILQMQDFLSKFDVTLSSNQIPYSLLNRSSQHTVDVCLENNIQVLAYFPFAMGLLTGKYNLSSLDKSQTTNGYLTTSRKSPWETRDLQRYASRIGPLLHVMEKIAMERDVSVSQVALNYVISKGAIPIPGARNRSQVLENAGACGWRLNDTEQEALESASNALGFGFEGAGLKLAHGKFVGYGIKPFVLD